MPSVPSSVCTCRNCQAKRAICNAFPTTFCTYVPQFLVTSDQKLVTSDQKGLPSDHKAPDHKDVVVTDNECWRRRTTNFWSAAFNMQFANQPLQRQYYWQYTFLLRSKNSRCKSTCFKRHVPPHTCHTAKNHNIYKPPSPPSPPTPPTTLVIARPPIKAAVAVIVGSTS